MFQAEKDSDKNILRDMKMFIDADFDGLEFEQVDSHFVDSSGFGKKGEPALTADEFLEKVKAGRFYAIIGIGRFQIHIGEYIKIVKPDCAITCEQQDYAEQENSGHVIINCTLCSDQNKCLNAS